MKSEFDHVFICVSLGASEADELTAFGLTEGLPNVHPGQGTACRRFFFANSYLELVWINNTEEALSKLIQPTHLWERWTRRAAGACPFGLGFRSKAQNDAAIPFGNWEYRPPYLPAPLCLHVGTNASVVTEPMLFYLPSSLRRGQRSAPIAHRSGLCAVTRVELISPYADRLSLEMVAVRDLGLVRLRAGADFSIELGFDGESHGQRKDFRPLLPLVFSW